MEGQWLITDQQCQKVEGKQADVRGTIHAWTELLLGDLSLETGCFLDKFEVNNQQMMTVFPQGKQSFYDYF